MFENDNINEFDLQMRSILESGQEEVPASLWEGVSAGLDKAARRRKAALWLRYSGIAVAAAAAVAVGVILNHSTETGLVPADGQEGLIAVVEENGSDAEETIRNEVSDGIGSVGKAPAPKSLIAMADIPANGETETVGQTDRTIVTTAPIAEEAPEAAETEVQTDSQTPEQPKTVDVFTDEEDWEDEDEPARKKINTSLVISGIAGTNSPQNRGGSRPLRSPGMLKEPVKTTVEQVGGETTYGIPVSVGLGVKINFTKRWALGLGVNYTLLTSNFNGKYTKVENGVPSLPLTERVKNTQHYIGIPINAYYNIVSRDFINFYAYAGGTVEKCVGNRYQIQTTPVINHSEPVKGVQLSANAGIGVEFLLGKRVGIYLDPSLRYYFKSGQPKSIRTAQPLMLGFEAGVRFNL